MSLTVGGLRPLQAMAASLLFRKRRLLVVLPRQKGGKTELGVRITHDLVARPFTKSTLTLAKSHTALKKMAREKFLRLFDPKLFKVNTEMVCLKELETSVGFLDSVDKEPDRIRGGTYSFIHWAEMAFSKFDLGQTILDVFDKVINPTMTETDGYFYGETTLNGKNEFWDFWQMCPDLGISTLKVSLSDMVYLGLVSQEEYEKIRSTTQPDVFQQEYECEWVTFQGKAYPELDPAWHIWPDMPPPEPWQLVVMGIDWGYTPSATCVLFGYTVPDLADPDGEPIICIFDEHYKTEEMPIATAAAIKLKQASWGFNRFACVADHEEDRINELHQRGIPCGKADKVDVLGNRVQIKEKLFLRKMRIHPRCQYLLRDLDAAVWHPKKSDKGELDDTQCTWGHYDAESALRYLVRELSGHREDRPERNPHEGRDSLSAAAWNMNRRRIEEICQKQ